MKFNWLMLGTWARKIASTIGAILVVIGLTDQAHALQLGEEVGKIVDAVATLVGSVLWLWSFVSSFFNKKVQETRAAEIIKLKSELETAKSIAALDKRERVGGIVDGMMNNGGARRT